MPPCLLCECPLLWLAHLCCARLSWVYSMPNVWENGQQRKGVQDLGNGSSALGKNPFVYLGGSFSTSSFTPHPPPMKKKKKQTLKDPGPGWWNKASANLSFSFFSFLDALFLMCLCVSPSFWPEDSWKRKQNSNWVRVTRGLSWGKVCLAVTGES